MGGDKANVSVEHASTVTFLVQDPFTDTSCVEDSESSNGIRSSRAFLDCAAVTVADGVLWLCRCVDFIESTLTNADVTAMRAAEELLRAADSESETLSDNNRPQRLRLRLSRPSAEVKWGVKWHAQVFKRQRHLVVDDIAEGSPFDIWNGSQATGRRVRYGDRLVRAQDARADESGTVAAADKLRQAFADQNVVDFVFWRPAGFAEYLPTMLIREHGEGSAGKIGLWSAVICVAYSIRKLADPSREAKTALASALDSVRAELSDAMPLLSPLSQEVLDTFAIEQCQVRVNLSPRPADAEGPVNPSPRPADAEGQVEFSSVTELDGPCEPHVVGATITSGASTPEATETQGYVGVGEVPRVVASEVYSCRKCRRALFTDAHLVPHSSEGATKDKANYRKWGSAEGRRCSSMFIKPMPWMGNVEEQTGRLACPCGAKLGNFCWFGLECSCGGWQSPGFQIHDGRLDRMPITAADL